MSKIQIRDRCKRIANLPNRRLQSGADALPALLLLPILLARREVCATVLLPTGFVCIRALRTLLAVADRLQAVGRNAELGKELLGGSGAPVAETQVVFGRSALVAMSLD